VAMSPGETALAVQKKLTARQRGIQSLAANEQTSERPPIFRVDASLIRSDDLLIRYFDNVDLVITPTSPVPPFYGCGPIGRSGYASKQGTD